MNINEIYAKQFSSDFCCEIWLRYQFHGGSDDFEYPILLVYVLVAFSET